MTVIGTDPDTIKCDTCGQEGNAGMEIEPEGWFALTKQWTASVTESWDLCSVRCLLTAVERGGVG